MVKEHMLSPEQVMEKLMIRESFNIKEADLETRKFRKLCQLYKEELKYLGFRIGDKVFYFEGAGKDKIMLRHFVAGPDITQYSAEKLWVVYGNEHPVIRKTILKAIADIQGGNDNVFKEEDIKQTYKKVKETRETRPQKKETEEIPYSEDFIRASDLI